MAEAARTRAAAKYFILDVIVRVISGSEGYECVEMVVLCELLR